MRTSLVTKSSRSGGTVVCGRIDLDVDLFEVDAPRRRPSDSDSIGQRPSTLLCLQTSDYPRCVPAMGDFKAKAREAVKKTFSLSTKQEHKLVLTLPTAFVLDARRVTGLGVVFAALVHAQKTPSQGVFVTGHTDPSGSASHNQTLSEQRAENVSLLLRGKRGTDTPFKSKIGVDGVAGPETWGAIYDTYMVELMDLTGPRPSRPPSPPSTRTASAFPSRRGCRPRSRLSGCVICSSTSPGTTSSRPA